MNTYVKRFFYKLYWWSSSVFDFSKYIIHEKYIHDEMKTMSYQFFEKNSIYSFWFILSVHRKITNRFLFALDGNVQPFAYKCFLPFADRPIYHSINTMQCVSPIFHLQCRYMSRMWDQNSIVDKWSCTHFIIQRSVSVRLYM